MIRDANITNTPTVMHLDLGCDNQFAYQSLVKQHKEEHSHMN
jgi:hypothetical protein